MKFFFLLLLAVLAVGGKRLNSKIINGTPVVPGSYPDITWGVGLIIDSSILCGGSLLADPNTNENIWVLTSAHCVYNIATDQAVSPGSIEIKFGVSILIVDVYRAQHIYVHNSYNSANANNGNAVDLALIKMNYAVPTNAFVTPIALPRTVTVTPPPSGKYIVAGYGATVSTAQGSTTPSDDLLWAEISFVDQTTCQAAAPFTLGQTVLCAKLPSETSDSCQVSLFIFSLQSIHVNPRETAAAG